MKNSDRWAFWSSRKIPWSASERFLKILVVDDYEVGGEALQQALIASDFNSRYVTTGGAALACIENWLPEVIVLDINMPQQDGFQVAALLRSLPRSRELCLIAFTSMDERSVRERGQGAGFDAYCQKGPGLLPLLNVINTLIVGQVI